MNAHLATALVLMTLGAASAMPARERIRLVVIVSSSQTVRDLSSGDLRRIYVGEMTRWPDGHRIVPVMLPTRSRESAVFLKRVVRMSAIDFAQEWIGAVFRGRAPAPPVVVANAGDALRFVASHPESIAVIPDELSPGVAPSTSGGDVSAMRPEPHIGVRVINIDGRSPRASEYPLNW